MVLLLLSLLLHGYIGLRIVPALAEPWAAAGFAALLVLSAALMPFGLWARRIRSEALADRVAALGLFCMGLFSTLLVLTLGRDVVLLLAAAASALVPSGFSQADLSAMTAWIVPILGGAVTL